MRLQYYFWSLLLFFHCYSFSSHELMTVDFDHSMEHDQYSAILAPENNALVYLFFKKLYEKNCPDRVHISDECKIPKHFHVVWFGGAYPQCYRMFLQSWIDNHPGWTIIFWVDNPQLYNGDLFIESFDELEYVLDDSVNKGKIVIVDVAGLSFDNRCFFDKAQNYGEKSDILKWEVVYRFGGVYLDVDLECLKPLDQLHYYYDFYTGVQPLDTNRVQLGAALFAAKPYHPILKQCVETIKDNQSIKMIVAKTGPLHFTKSFLEVAGALRTIDIAFPASYFYPCGYEQRGSKQEVWLQPESLAVHHWAGSWLKKSAWEPR